MGETSHAGKGSSVLPSVALGHPQWFCGVVACCVPSCRGLAWCLGARSSSTKRVSASHLLEVPKNRALLLFQVLSHGLRHPGAAGSPRSALAAPGLAGDAVFWCPLMWVLGR